MRVSLIEDREWKRVGGVGARLGCGEWVLCLCSVLGVIGWGYQFRVGLGWLQWWAFGSNLLHEMGGWVYVGERGGRRLWLGGSLGCWCFAH